jgi:hypothetical protein
MSPFMLADLLAAFFDSVAASVFGRSGAFRLET